MTNQINKSSSMEYTIVTNKYDIHAQPTIHLQLSQPQPQPQSQLLPPQPQPRPQPQSHSKSQPQTNKTPPKAITLGLQLH
ncbi:hypothetical protein CsatB_028238 [Cannabis sativa]